MIDQENRDNASSAQIEPQTQRRAYAKPVVIDLGDVRELTRGGSGPNHESHGGAHS